MEGSIHLQNLPSVIHQFPQYLWRPCSLPRAGHYRIAGLRGSWDRKAIAQLCCGNGPADGESPGWGLQGAWGQEASSRPPLQAQRRARSLHPPLLPARISRFVLFCSLHQATLNPNPSRRHKLTFYYVYLWGSLLKQTCKCEAPAIDEGIPGWTKTRWPWPNPWKAGPRWAILGQTLTSAPAPGCLPWPLAISCSAWHPGPPCPAAIGSYDFWSTFIYKEPISWAAVGEPFTGLWWVSGRPGGLLHQAAGQIHLPWPSTGTGLFWGSFWLALAVTVPLIPAYSS